MKATRRKDQPKASGEIRNYVYGARVAKEDLPTAMDILYKANRYRNALTEIIRRFDEEKRAVYLQMCPQLATLQTRVDALNSRIEAVYAENIDKNIKEQRRLKDVAAIEKVTQLKAERAELFLEAKALRSQVLRMPDTKRLFEEVNARRHSAELTARAECDIHWGTYLLCEEAIKVAEETAANKWKKGWRPRGGRPLRPDDFTPGFKRFQHSGAIGVQLQKPTFIEDILAGTCSSLTLKPLQGLIYQGRLRIGTVEGTRDPTWLPFTVKLHRPVPPGSRVRWVKLMAHKVGTHTKWELLLVLSNESFPVDPKRETKNGVVAIDIGWRKLGKGLRVMYWADDSGKHGEISFPQETIDRLRKVEDLQSIRDKNFEAIKAGLRTWISAATGVPEWFTSELLHMEMWRAQARLAALILRWRQQRFTGDQDIYARLEAWRVQDKHLLDWQEFQRRGEKKWRKNFYRNVAAWFSRKYRKAVVEDFDLRVFSREPDQLEEDDESIIRYYKNVAGVSEFRGFLAEKMTVLDKAPAEFTTQQCHRCLHVEKFDAASSITHTCPKCQATWDQDYNACMNLLRLASAWVPPASPVALAGASA